jgi:hypothetical protein
MATTQGRWVRLHPNKALLTARFSARLPDGILKGHQSLGIEGAYSPGAADS